MSLDSDARHLAEKDFRARFGSLRYDRKHPEMQRYMELRFKYWVDRLAGERGFNKRHAVDTLMREGI